MEKRRETLDGSVKDYAAEKRRSIDGHPKVEMLAAYHRGGLPEEAREEIRDHLTFCEECASLVLDLDNFAKLAPPGEEYRLSDRDVATQKEALKARIHEQEEPTAKLLTFSRRAEPSEERARSSIPWWYHGAAAALFVVCMGLAFRVATLRQTVAERSFSIVNPTVETLLPSNGGLRGSAPQEALHVPPRRDLVLVLVLLEKTSFPDYRVEIYGEEDRLLWSGDGFEPSGEGQFSLVFPRELPKDGSFRLELYGVAGGERELLAEYPLSLVGGARP